MILILKNKEAFYRMSRMRIASMNFIAYGVEDDCFMVVKNRYDGRIGMIIDKEKLQWYIEKFQNL